jgi:hypothetical protein
MFPKFPSTLDVGLFYAPQLRQDDSDETDTLPDGVYLESDELAKHIATRNSAHIAVITLLLQYPKVSGKSSFRLSELWEYYVANWDISTLAKEKLIFLVFLQLYEYGTVDIEIWKNDPNKSHDCQGEFDLSYALGKIYAKHPDMFGVRAMHVFKGKGEVQLSWTDDSCGIPCKQIVNIDDLEFTVEMM